MLNRKLPVSTQLLTRAVHLMLNEIPAEATNSLQPAALKTISLSNGTSNCGFKIPPNIIQFIRGVERNYLF